MSHQTSEMEQDFLFYFMSGQLTGAPVLIVYDRRPVFTYPRYTMHMLEYVIVRAKITSPETTSSLTTNL